ncbi:MAG: hypothetical protein VKJ02_00535 [Snowella sp.]|nr:hypothetical protein [Snowella sp.]
MSKNLTDILQNLPIERRKKIAERSADLVYETLKNNNYFQEDTINSDQTTELSSQRKNSQTKKLTFYTFRAIHRYLKILSAIQAKNMAEIMKNAISLYLAYRHTLGETNIDSTQQDTLLKTSKMIKVTIYLPDSLFEELTNFTGNDNELISWFIYNAVEFYSSRLTEKIQNIDDDENYINDTQLNQSDLDNLEKTLILI